MKEKVINSVICSVFDRWIKTIKDEQLKSDVRSKVIISGGCIASMLLNEEVNDYDFYFTDIDVANRIAKYYIEQFNDGRTPTIYIQIGLIEKDGQLCKPEDRVIILVPSIGVAGTKNADVNDSNNPITSEEELELETNGKINTGKYCEKFHPVYFTSNAITLSDDIQLVMRFIGTPSEIHKNYDFVHCTNYWDSETRKLILNQNALESILAKDLNYMGSLYPIASVIRSRKFLQRGWTINAGQYLKMCFQVSNLDLMDIKVLKEQLVGVDTIYFQQLIDNLSTDGVEINQEYVCKLIDEIF